jgi:hypothetical protein
MNTERILEIDDEIERLQNEIGMLEYERDGIELAEKMDKHSAWIDKHNVSIDEITVIPSTQFKYDECAIHIKKWIIANTQTKWVVYYNKLYLRSDILDSVNDNNLYTRYNQTGISGRIIIQILEERIIND